MTEPYKPDYWIRGEQTQFVELELDPGKAVVAERGSLMIMDEGIKLEPVAQVKSQASNWRDKLRDAVKRLVTDHQHLLVYTNTDSGNRRIAFAAPYPGKILPIDLAQFDGELTCHKDTFLCATHDVSIGFEYKEKRGKSIFGYRRMLLKKLTGDGLAFLHAGGSIYERELRAGEKIYIDTGYVVAMTKTIVLEFVEIPGVLQEIYRRGERVSFATLTGPGKIWLGALPFNRLVNRAFFRFFFPEM